MSTTPAEPGRLVLPGALFSAVRRVAEKATSATWEAVRNDTGERVAVRVGGRYAGALEMPLSRLAPLIWDRDAVWEPIAHEVRVLARIAGPGVPALSVPPDLPDDVVASKWLSGAVSLASLAPVEPRIANAVGAAVCAVLERVHALGVLHRDISPANILLDPDDPSAVWLVDWELASLDGRRPFGPVGTRGFVAPELLALRTGCHQPRAIDQRVDLYGLAASLYFAMTGEAPYGRDAMTIVNGEPLQARGLTDRQHAVFQGLLACDVERRTPSAHVARAAFEALASPSAALPPTPVAPAAPPAGRPPQSSALRLEAALRLVDEGAFHQAARYLDRLGLDDRLRAGLGYAYLAWRLGERAIAATLLLASTEEHGLRRALSSACSGEAHASDAAHGPRATWVLAAAALEREAWVEAFAHLDLNEPDVITVELVKARLDALTRGPLDDTARSEITLWATALADAGSPDTMAAALELACRAYPGPDAVTNYLPNHALVIAAAHAYPAPAGTVAARLVQERRYPIHERVGIRIVGFDSLEDAVGASMVELGLRRRALALAEGLAPERWRVRARLQLACGELDACRRELEAVPRADCQQLPYFELHIAHLLHTNRPHVAASVYDRARDVLEAADAAGLHTLGAFARLRANDRAGVRELLPHIERDGGVLASELLSALEAG